MPIQPGFYVCNSNDVDNLALSAAYLMRTHPPRDPLACEQVVVMNRGMQTYLSQVSARLNGIAAQCQYQQLWQLIFRIHHWLHPQADPRNLYSRLYLTLNILGLKPVWAQPPAAGQPDFFKKMRDYLNDDAQGTKAYLLAAKLADTFDQYQMYRPQWIQTWNSWTAADFAQYAAASQQEGPIHAFVQAVSHQDRRILQALHSNVWQMHLWTLLKGNLAPKVLPGPGVLPQSDDGVISENDDPLLYLDRSGIMQHLQKSLGSAAPGSLPQLPDKIFIFGVSALPPQVISFLQVLARHCAVFLLLLNPCEQYWGDLTSSFKDFFARFKRARALQPTLCLPRSRPPSQDLSYLKPSLYQASTQDAGAGAELVAGNALLLGLGRQGMDNLSLLCALEPLPQFIDSFNDPGEDSLLHCLQHQMLKLEPPAGKKNALAPQDNSLEIHVCHTRLREVQVLRDAILQRFKQAAERGEKLQPREIVVMVPTINTYAPYITAVFGQAALEGESDPNFLPYAICDRTQAEESPITDAVLTLLNISAQRVTNVLITDLLSIEPLAARFGIVPDDIKVIEEWFREGAVYWGLDDSDTQAESAIPLPGTFEHGLDRMLLGTMAGDLPQQGAFAQIEGDDAQLLGRLCAFVFALKQLRTYFTPHLQLPPQAWRENLQARILDSFFVFDENSALERTAILQAVAQLQDICRDLKKPPLITLPIFHALLQAQLSAERNFQPFLRGKINFCSLVPMRAVPFKHIFILGLNDGDFPRRERMPGFNLLALSGLYQRGDRSRALDDRFLFLDALLSARESIYFSYIGESPISQQELPPAVVLTELLDYIAAHFSVSSAEGLPAIQRRLVIKEHLTSYHPDNFTYRQEEGCAVHYPSFDSKALLPVAQERKPRPLLGNAAEWGFSLDTQLELDLGALAAFLAEPCRSFLRRNLKIYLPSGDEGQLQSAEDFSRNVFANAPLVQALLLSPDEAAASALLDAAARQGTEPYGVFGTLNRAAIVRTVQTMQQAMMQNGIVDPHALRHFQADRLQRAFTLQENGQAVTRSVWLAVSALEYVQGEKHSLIVLYPYAAFGDKLNTKPLLQAFAVALGYYLKTGRCVPCLLIDAQGRSLTLNALSGADYEASLTQALTFYAQGTCRPWPSCNGLLRRVPYLKPAEGLSELLHCDPDKLRLSPEFCYLFADGSCLETNPHLAAMFMQLAEFYQKFIAEHMQEVKA